MSPSARFTPVGNLWTVNPASVQCAGGAAANKVNLGVIWGLPGGGNQSCGDQVLGGTVKDVSEVRDT
jgi:hypothetical protein